MTQTAKRLFSILAAVVIVFGFAVGVTFAQTSTPSPTTSPTMTPSPTTTPSVQGENTTVPAGAPSTGAAH